MRVLKIIGLALTFVSCLFGAGLSSGKEVAVFLGEASIPSVCLCGILIGAFALPFITLGIASNGQTTDILFAKHSDVGSVIIKIINFIFLSAMLGGAEALLNECFNFNGGCILTACISLVIFQFGDRFIKALCLISIPLTLLTLLLLFTLKGNSIEGKFTASGPILYAAMNTFCASIYATKNSNNLKLKDAFFISIIIAVTVSLLLLLIRSIIVNNEIYNIPLYYASKDTNITLLVIISIFVSIMTSTLTSLKLCTGKSEFSPIITICFALMLSFLGFDKIIKYIYPLIGLIGITALFLSVYRVMQTIIKKRKYKDCTCNEQRNLL